MRKITKIASFIVALALMVTSFATFFVKNDITLHANAATVAEGTVYRPFTSNKAINTDYFVIGGVPSSYNPNSATPFATMVTANSTVVKNIYGYGDLNFHGANGTGFVSSIGWESYEKFVMLASLAYASVIQFTAPADGTYELDINAALAWGSRFTTYVHKNNTVVSSHKFENVKNTYYTYEVNEIYLEKGDTLTVSLTHASDEPLCVNDFTITYVRACEKAYTPVGSNGHKVYCTSEGCDVVFAELEAHDYDSNDVCKKCEYVKSIDVGTSFSLFTSSKTISEGFAVGGVQSFDATSATPFANIVMGTETVVKGVEGKGDQNFLGANGIGFVAPSYWDSNGLFFIVGSDAWAPVIQFTAPATGSYKLDINAAMTTWDDTPKTVYLHRNDTAVASKEITHTVDAYSVNVNNFGAYSVENIYLEKGDVLSITLIQVNGNPLYAKDCKLTYTCACEISYESVSEDGHKISCDTCGTVFTELEAHDFDANGKCSICEYECAHDNITCTKIDNTNHKVACSVCGYVTVASEAHDLDDEGKCNDCDYACDHVNVTYTKIDDIAHKATCDDCGYETVDSEEHDLDAEGKCNDCDYACDHENVTYTEIDGVNHKATCDDCGCVTVDSEAHDIDAANGICSKCEYECSHQIVDYESNDETGHKVTCTVCGYVTLQNEAHDVSATTGECSKCDYECDHNATYTEIDAATHKATCDICGYVTVTSEAHNFSEGVCDDCDYECKHDEVTYSKIDDVAHKATCDNCGYVTLATEDHDLDGDGKCNKCDYGCTHDNVIYEEIDNTNHKVICDDCGYVTNESEAHELDDEGKCDKCDYECDHTNITYEEIDATNHKATCDDCGIVKITSEAHDLDSEGKCTLCDYECDHASVSYEEIEDGHMATCDKCGFPTITSEPHDVDASTGECKDCEYECPHDNKSYTSIDGTNHKQTCDDCGYVTIASEAHNGGEATCEDKAACEDCKAEYGDLKDHSYVEGVCTECGADEPVNEPTNPDTSDKTVSAALMIAAMAFLGYALVPSKKRNIAE